MELDTAMSPIPVKDRETVETKTETESTNTFNSASVLNEEFPTDSGL